MCEEQITLDTVFDAINTLGYHRIDRAAAYSDEASGYVSLPGQHRRESRPTGDILTLSATGAAGAGGLFPSRA